jgi:hypothetical protein
MSEPPANAEEPYVVTRGNPPREYQFKKGQSGNPKGRPKGSKQISTLMEEELDRKVEVTLHGRRTKLSKRHVMVRQLVDRALKNDHKAITTCLAIQGAMNGSCGKGEALSSIAEAFDTMVSKDELIFMEYVARQRAADAEGPDPEDPEEPSVEGGDRE